MRFAILGLVELRVGDRRPAIGGPRQVALLALLLLHRNRSVSIDQLHDALWMALYTHGASKRVHVAVARLRSRLERGAALGFGGATVSWCAHVCGRPR